MLDAFLEVVCEKTKQAESRERIQALLNRLPSSELMKIANCTPSSDMKIAGEGCWLDQFRGTPLLDQAIEIEKAELQVQMDDAARRRAQVEADMGVPRWDEIDLQRQEINIKRKLLELELAGADVGGQEGEDVGGEELPVDLEAVESASASPVSKAAPQSNVEVAPPEPALAEEKPKLEEKKPPVAKVIKETTEKPIPEKIDVKAASVRMRFALAAHAIKEAQLANGARGFQSTVKEAGVTKAPGSLGRGLQLLTGSRARALEGQAANRGKVLARNTATGSRVAREATFGTPTHSYTDAVGNRAIHASEVGIQGAKRGIGRATREAAAERTAVGGARKDLAKAVVGGAAGVGAGRLALGGNKTAGVAAGVARGLEATVAAGSQKIRSATKVVQDQVAKNNTPLLSRNQKLLGGGVAAGVGLGALARKKPPEKTASLSAERVEEIKLAFGAALMQGLKGMGSFAGTAAKSIGAAGKAGGVQAAGQAALNAGRSGAMRAGNFMAQHPGAGAALVAAPAMAAGYAAGRQ